MGKILGNAGAGVVGIITTGAGLFIGIVGAPTVVGAVVGVAVTVGGGTIVVSSGAQIAENAVLLFAEINKASSQVSNNQGSGNTPGNNQAQNKQALDAANRYNLSDEGRRLLHDTIGGQGYSYQEILEEAKAIAELGGKYVK